MIKVGVIGANGFLGLELLRILSIHPKVEISKILKRENNIEDTDISIITVLIAYPKWYPDSDFWTYVKRKVQNQMREDKKTFFVFDSSTEGFSTIYGEPYFDILYKMAKDYKTDVYVDGRVAWSYKEYASRVEAIESHEKADDL